MAKQYISWYPPALARSGERERRERREREERERELGERERGEGEREERERERREREREERGEGERPTRPFRKVRSELGCELKRPKIRP